MKYLLLTCFICLCSCLRAPSTHEETHQQCPKPLFVARDSALVLSWDSVSIYLEMKRFFTSPNNVSILIKNHDKSVRSIEFSDFEISFVACGDTILPTNTFSGVLRILPGSLDSIQFRYNVDHCKTLGDFFIGGGINLYPRAEPRD